MNIAYDLSTFAALRARLDAPVGFVPTMGALHEGHLSLVRRARAACRTVVVSLFVNPTQFSASEDLSAYPRPVERDLALLEAEGVDVTLSPPESALYPPGFDTWVHVAGLTERLEGAARPSHFRGVTTIVAKLFHLVQPHRAYFGQKDAQQALVIDKMIRDLDFRIVLEIGPTIRESDGLAMSSRNVNLSPDERSRAGVLYRCLQDVEQRYRAGERSAEALRAAMRALLDAEPLAQADYISVAALDTLAERATVHGPTLVSLAVRIGSTRLIDNLVLPPGAPLVQKEI